MSLINRFLVIIVLMIPFFSDSQKEYPFVSTIEKDTIITFHIEQGRQLIRYNEERKELKEINVILSEQIKMKDTIIHSQEDKINNLYGIIDEKDGIIVLNNDLTKICEEEKKSLLKEIKRHKRGKIFAFAGMIAVGVIAIVF